MRVPFSNLAIRCSIRVLLRVMNRLNNIRIVDFVYTLMSKIRYGKHVIREWKEIITRITSTQTLLSIM